MMISLLLLILLYPTPKIVFNRNEIDLYEDLLSTINEGQFVNYELPYPKYRFLQYLSLQGQYVFHGSNYRIEKFEPREQTLYSGKLTKAVFASTDPTWAIFFAVFNRRSLIGGFRNGCIVGRNRKYHYYSLNESTMKNKPWTEGIVYILPRNQFTKSGQGKVHFDEWISHDPVKPLGMMSVTLSDFYYKDKVATHKDKESLLKTWLLYKVRTKIAIDSQK